jgi:hypothetical protein
MTTIKQYGSLTLDLNTVKQAPDFFKANLLIRLHDGNQITLKKKWHYQFQNDYLNFTLQKKAQVIKEAFEYVWDGNWEVYRFQIPFNVRNKDIRIDIYPSGISVCCSNIKVEPVNFDFNSTDKATWIRYAQQIRDKYLDSIVDPVKVANEVLKSRELDKEWQILSSNQESFCLDIRGKARIHFNLDIILKTLKVYSYNCSLDIRRDLPTTNPEWVKAIESALDKYYEQQQLPLGSEAKPQLSEVDLKLMLGKALKDNDLIAEIVSIFYLEKRLYINVSIPKNKSIQWIKYLDGVVSAYLLTPNNKENFLSYITPNVGDWQTIFSDSLAQYKKLTAPKLTKNDIIECLESALEGLPVESVSGTLDDALVGTIEVKLTDKGTYSFGINKEGRVRTALSLNGWCCTASPKTKEDWQSLFKISLDQLLPVSKEPTLVDLIKQAFSKYQWSNNKDNSLLTGAYPGWQRKSYINLELKQDSIIEANICDSKNGKVIYKIESPQFILTKENLANYTNWEQWLEDLIKVNQNLKDLEQSPNLVVKELNKVKQQPQRVSNLSVSTNVDDLLDQLASDLWS